MDAAPPTLSSDAFTDYHVPAFIGGSEHILNSTFDVVSPYTGTTAWRCSSASVKDAISAVEVASVAFKSWSQTKGSVRRDILLKAAQLMEDRTDELAACMHTEMGSNISSSSSFIVPLGISMLRDCAARISAIQGWIPEVSMDGQSAMVQQVPIGVVLGIVPWNAPYVFGNRSIGTALAAGCTTVIKATELSPRCYQLIAKCFHDAGLPAGVLNVISCRPSDAAEVTNAMIAHPAVRKINFTGSTAVGRMIAVECARNLKPSLMELGGKNSAIVLKDANLENAAVQCLVGGFANSGQICMSTDRVIVEKSIAPQFREVLKAIAGKMMPVTNPAPTLVNGKSKERIEAVLAETVTNGAEIMQGEWYSEPSSDNSNSTGVFLRPTIINNVKPSMSVWQEEMFGSVIAIAEADDEEHAITMANSTGYGLSAAVFSEDWKRAMVVAKRLESGAVHINSMTVHDEPALPFGGVKNSGWGRFNGTKGLEEFLITKSITWMD